MSHRITSLGDDPAERDRLSEFLAVFVRDGELPEPRPGDADPAVWRQRFRWWWDDNPNCREDSPRGFVLRTTSEEIVGFAGYIPLPYECGGKDLPSLLATTFFVREGHRSAVLGLMNRQRALGKTRQIVDGSPSPEMRRILEKFGYRAAGTRRQYFFPVAGSGAVARFALRRLGWSLRLPLAGRERMETGPDAWVAMPVTDATVRPRLDPATMAWLCRSGSQSRQIFRLDDPGGKPLAQTLGIYKKRAGMGTLHLLCHEESLRGGFVRLLRRLVSDPAAGLNPSTRLVVSSSAAPIPGFPQQGRQVDASLHYHLPPGWDEKPRTALSLESDLVLL